MSEEKDDIVLECVLFQVFQLKLLEGVDWL